jgi:hypothetical protein
MVSCILVETWGRLSANDGVRILHLRILIRTNWSLHIFYCASVLLRIYIVRVGARFRLATTVLQDVLNQKNIL